MQANRKRRIIYAVGLSIAIFVIVSMLLDANWVFRVFLILNDRKITLDTNDDGRDDYFEFWENAELVLSEWDTNYDGKIDYINRFRGKTVSLIELDADYDGYFEYREIWTEDGAYRIEMDQDKDGVFDPVDLKPIKPQTSTQEQ